MHTELTQAITLMFRILGGLVMVFGAVTIAFGFGGDEGFARGWNSRKKQGLILTVAGAIMMMLSQINNMLSEMGHYTCTPFPVLAPYFPALGLAISAYGVGQFALNMINDGFGNRMWGVRLLIAGTAVAQFGKVIEFIFDGL